MEDNRRSADRTNAPSALYSDQASHVERRKESGSTVKFGTNQVIDIGRDKLEERDKRVR